MSYSSRNSSYTSSVPDQIRECCLAKRPHLLAHNSVHDITPSGSAKMAGTPPVWRKTSVLPGAYFPARNVGDQGGERLGGVDRIEQDRLRCRQEMQGFLSCG